MFKKIAVIALVATAASTSANAADLLVAPQANAPASFSSGFDWSGFYVGAVGGYVGGRTVSVSGAPPVTITADPNGLALGATVGVNAQFDQFVLGVEGEVLWAGIEGSGTSPGGNVGALKSGWVGSIKTRAGVAFDSVLVYAHGGLAFTDFYGSLHTAGGVFVSDYKTSRTGFTVGAGLEAALTDNVSAKIEYAYSDFGTWNGTFSNGSTADLTHSTHAIKAGINFHF